MSRIITDLHPTLQSKISELQNLCAKNGITIGISECLRTVEEQDLLYAQGRTKAGNIVTNAKGSSYSSMHQWGVAFDFYLKVDVNKDGKVDSHDSYDNTTKLFEKVGELGKSIGLEWGGDWKSIQDRPHFQLPDWGSTTSKLKSTYGTPEKFMDTWVAVTTSASSNTIMIGVVTPDIGVNIRKKPAKVNSAKLLSIQKGETVTVLEKNAGSADGYQWSKIKYGATVGYCATSCLKITESEAPVKKKVTYAKNAIEPAKDKNNIYKGKWVTTANLNLRYGAGTDKAIINTIPKGSEVRCYGFNTVRAGLTWFLITYDKYTGFVSSKYLKKAQ